MRTRVFQKFVLHDFQIGLHYSFLTLRGYVSKELKLHILFAQNFVHCSKLCSQTCERCLGTSFFLLFKGERRDGEFFRSSSTRGSDNKYSTNNMRRSDSFFQSSTDRGASDRGDNQQRRSNSFYDQRSSGAQHYEQRNRNDLQTSGGSKNAPGSRQEYDNRRGPDFNSRSGSTATGYPAPSNPPFPPSNKTFSTAQSGNNNFQSHEAKVQMERNRSYIGNQDYEKKPGRDDEKP